MNKLFYIFFITVISCYTYLMLSSFAPKPAVKQVVALEIVYDSISLIKNKNQIVYKKNNLLNWKDFQGAVDENSFAVANSAVGLKYNADVVASEDKMIVQVNLASYFDKKNSWYKKTAASDYILSHEQRHFDIARVGAYFIKQEMQKLRYTEDNVMDQLDKAYEIGWKKYFALQADYDKTTNHSIYKIQQTEWDAKIDSLLAVAYAN